jgi:hypothetical protein
MKNDRSTSTVLTRRRLLARVGLAASAAYMAPAMVGLNAARASGASGGNSGASRGGNSGASRGGRSGASRGGNSGASRGGSSGPSRGRSRGRAGNDVPGWLDRLMRGA